jgi:hypothetical protein
MNECDKCKPAIEAINQAYLNATPVYRRQMLVREAATLLDRADEVGCVPGSVCGMLSYVINMSEQIGVVK